MFPPALRLARILCSNQSEQEGVTITANPGLRKRDLVSFYLFFFFPSSAWIFYVYCFRDISLVFFIVLVVMMKLIK